MVVVFDPSGLGSRWAAGLMSPSTYLSLQFWASIIVVGACIPQLHIGRKFRWPFEPGRLQILGYCVGMHLRSGHLALKLGDAGTYADFAAAIIGRLGIALQAIVALFSIDDVLSAPDTPRPLITWMLVAIVMVQCRALTAYSPRNHPS